MKKFISILLSAVLVASISACGSSKVVDYTGKKVSSAEKNEEESGAVGKVVKDEKTSSEEKVEPEKQPSDKAAYTADIVKFDISESTFEDGYRYEAIVEVENTGNSNIYITGTSFDIEDANKHLIQSDNIISCCPDVIKPGEKGYLYNQFGTSLDGVTDIKGLQLVPQYVVKTTTQTPQEYEVSDISLKDDTFGVKAVGRVTNGTDKDQSYLYIQILYYDADQNILGISGTSITDFLAGRTVSFEISGMNLPDGLTVDQIADYKVIAQETFFGW